MPGPMSSQGTKFHLSGSLQNRPVTAITKAAPAVVTITGAAPAVGDMVVVKGSGYVSLDNKPFKVSVVATQDVTLEGSDTTGELLSVAAGASMDMFGAVTEICVATFTRDSPAAATLDVTTLCDDSRQQLTGMKNNGTWTGTGFYDPGSAGQIVLRSAYDLGDKRVIDIEPPDHSHIQFLTQVNQLSETFGVDQPIALNTGGLVLGSVTYVMPPAP